MTDTMRTFHIDFEVENPMHPGARRIVRNALVDTGAQHDFEQPMAAYWNDGPEQPWSMSAGNARPTT